MKKSKKRKPVRVKKSRTLVEPRFGDGREEQLDIPRLMREAHAYLAKHHGRT